MVRNAQTTILLIEDSPTDVRLIQELLHGTSHDSFHVITASTLAKGLELLSQNSVDVILLDLGLPDSQGVDTFRAVYAQAPALPVIVLTVSDDEELGRQAIQEGVQDYLPKDVLAHDTGTATLTRTIRHAIERKCADVALLQAHKQVQALNEELQIANETFEERVRQRTENLASLVEQLQRHKTMVDLASEGIIFFDMNGCIAYWNRGAERLYGWSADEADGKNIHSLLRTTFSCPLEEITQTLFEKGEWHGELAHITAHGEHITVESYQTLQRDAAGNPTAVFEINTNITKRKRAEAQLRSTSAYARSLIEASLDPLVTISAEGTITDVNKATEDATGCSRDELVGSDFSDYFTEPDKAAAGYKQVFTDGVVRDYPLALRHRSGRVTEVVYNATLFRDKQGEVQGVFAAARDITERKQAEEQVRATSLYARNLIEASLDPLVTISAEGKITDVNKATEEVTGYLRHELIGSDFSDYFTEPAEARKGYEQVFANGFVRDYPLRIRHKSGILMDVLYNATVYRNETGNIQGIFAAARDITERKLAEEQLRATSLYARSLIEASLDPLVTISAEGTITDVNKATEEVTGYLRHELIGSDFSDYFTEPDDAKAGYQQVFADGFVRDYSLALRHKSGRVTDVLYNATVYRNDAGEIQGVFAAARDVTKRMRAEAAAREYAHRQEIIHNIIKAGNEAADLQSAIISMLDNTVSLTGFEGGAVYLLDAKRSVAELHYASGAEASTASKRIARADKHIARIYEGKPSFVDGHRALPPSEYHAGAVVTAHVPLSSKGVVIGHYVISGTVPHHFSAAEKELLSVLGQEAGTVIARLQAEEEAKRYATQLEHHTKHLEELVEERTKQLKDAERLAGIGETAAMIGHDLRNPLQALQYMVDLQNLRFERIHSGKLDADFLAKEREIFNRISEQVFYMDKIVGDLQDYARPITPEHEMISVGTLMDDVLRTLPVADDVDVITQLSDFTVDVDSHLMHRVFANLILNALQAMPNGGKLTVNATATDDSVAIQISDTGVGIPQAMRDKLFLPLATGKAKGTGLGLAVVKRIVEAHGGTIEFVSEEGKGTIFTVTLP
ncbi:MAG: PAS domain S-box protein [Halobacteriota archaeon]